LIARLLHLGIGRFFVRREEGFTKPFLARGVWPNLQAADQKEPSSSQPEIILKCQSYFLQSQWNFVEY
jgi:hypothetical protein